ncbi:hypothetical protein PMAYCL1PPCAC_06227, partial [Pristionchus mayeri]
FSAANYDRLMNPLFEILDAPLQTRPLFLFTLESISHLGMAVGKERFSGDGISVMTFLLPRLDSLLDRDMDLSISFLRVATAMGESFLPFLPTLMQTLTEVIRHSN